MKKFLLTTISLIIFSCMLSLLAYSIDTIEGTWLGTLRFNGTELRIVFNISKKFVDRKLVATIDSPDQGVKNIKVEVITFEKDQLVIISNSIKGMFEGKVKEDYTIEGNWKQAGMTIPLVLKRIKEIPEIVRPQEPKGPYPYKEEEVLYENKKDNIKLSGTLTLPQKGNKFPCVILITGSGPQDRNEMIFNHKPFLIIADYLTRQGISVLRFDDRGVGKSTGDFFKATTEDFAHDVIASIEYLKTRSEIDPKKIGLIGHSEGGIIASMVASQSNDVNFIVMLAGTGLTGEEILYLQSALILKTEGRSDEEINKNRELQKRIFKVVLEEKDNFLAEKKLREILSKEGIPHEGIDVKVKNLLSPWFKFFLSYDPKIALTKVKCPVLAINGEKDLQVPSKENLKSIEEALKIGGNKNYYIKELPDLNHLFQTCKTGSPSEYYKIEETFSPLALKIISDWILVQTK